MFNVGKITQILLLFKIKKFGARKTEILTRITQIGTNIYNNKRCEFLSEYEFAFEN